MSERAFRDILADFLEEESLEAPPTEASTQPLPPPLFLLNFQRPPPTRSPTMGYAFRAPRPAPAPPKPVIDLDQLRPEDRVDVLTLIALGARELESGLNRDTLKRAHRRLCKALHPDRRDQGLSASAQSRRTEDFLLAQGAFERLRQALASRQCES